MFETSRDPFDRLNLIEYNLAILAEASEAQASHTVPAFAATEEQYQLL